MKPGNLLFMVLVLLLGMAVAAPAVTIHTPWEFGPKEENLSQIISAWGFPVDNNTLRHATPLESLPAGAYSINHYAVDPGKPQPRGIYPLGTHASGSWRPASCRWHPMADPEETRELGMRYNLYRNLGLWFF